MCCLLITFPFYHVFSPMMLENGYFTVLYRSCYTRWTVLQWYMKPRLKRKNTIFWMVKLCSWVEIHRRFGGVIVFIFRDESEVRNIYTCQICEEHNAMDSDSLCQAALALLYFLIETVKMKRVFNRNLLQVTLNIYLIFLEYTKESQ